MDDEGDDIHEAPPEVLVDEFGVPVGVREITGYEVAEIEESERTDDVSGYPENWVAIRDEVKHARDWRCELCGFAAWGSAAIQAHHVNHDKSDNCLANLQVLCLICHQGKHGGGTGMGGQVSAEEYAELNEYRRSAAAMARLRAKTTKS